MRERDGSGDVVTWLLREVGDVMPEVAADILRVEMPTRSIWGRVAHVRGEDLRQNAPDASGATRTRRHGLTFARARPASFYAGGFSRSCQRFGIFAHSRGAVFITRPLQALRVRRVN